MKQCAADCSSALTSSLMYTLHYQKYVDMCSWNISFQRHGDYNGVGPPFAATTASTLLGRLSSRCWNIAVGTWVYSATRALVRLGTDAPDHYSSSTKLYNWHHTFRQVACVAEIAKYTNLKGCPHTFVYIVYTTGQKF